MAKSGQRFIKENRAPRVHIEYEVETYGSRQKVELPFVMGVLSDLSGKSTVEKKAMADRDFLDFDMDNFDQRMAAIAPRAAFHVDNSLTGEGKLAVDLTFNSMEDFSPGAVAKKVPALAKLLEAREQINDLMVYMDGKDGAQVLLDKLLKDPDLMKSLSAAPLKADDASEEPESEN
ncbi:type VI secretion system contractile sheath small subunit [Novosphingobium album (ex Liu et al. 2023)]|uniref:Type VI secretion system contractile sheath small subunit n=1 Tax=Novosphingobium album (ex Liu et al. 2023) TaxID=3031130 RepID=A0ABT5WUZ8_9SPHN|nr:type VI secretion system contractile sheath small subunit [Novosphingobium album (ex Liu et al. 2023)]MDE8653704.1 type VI secretion system contractile sheath small subunit [Novosphingobium album (ex Liu et al. 2023)]